MMESHNSFDISEFIKIRTHTVAGKLKLLIMLVIFVLSGFSWFVYHRVETINADYYKLEKYNFAFQNVFVYQTMLNQHQLSALQKIYTHDPSIVDFSIKDIIKGMDSATYAVSLADTVNYKLSSIQSILNEYQADVKKMGEKWVQKQKMGETSSAMDSVAISTLKDNPILGRYYSELYGVYFVKIIAAKDTTNNKLLAQTKRLPFIIMIMSLLMAVIVVIAGVYILRSLKKSIEKPKNMLEALAVGKLPDTVADTDDELSYIVKESNKLATNLRKACSFALEIGKGNFQHSFSPSSTEDALGNALVKMSQDLKAFNDKEKQQNWVVSGQAKFADIIRNRSSNLKETADIIISQLVKYLGANVGGLFFYDSESKQLEMLSCYAFDRIKFLKKNIEIGEGLVGQCFQEGETIYINDVPEDYLKLVSGLGNSNPRAILLVPMIYNDKVEGVIELGTINDFPPHYIHFIGQLGSMLAGAISTIKRNLYTEQLLSASQQQSQSLAQQEEELRQNLEELHATQEEIMRRETTYVEEIRQLKILLNK